MRSYTRGVWSKETVRWVLPWKRPALSCIYQGRRYDGVRLGDVEHETGPLVMIWEPPFAAIRVDWRSVLRALNAGAPLSITEVRYAQQQTG